MHSRERVLSAIHHQEPDRVPLDYKANPGIDGRLKKHFGLAADDDTGLRRALQVDMICDFPRYSGPPMHAPRPERRVDEWGVVTRWVEHGSGGYWDFCDFPLKDAEGEELAAYPLPDPDEFDIERPAAFFREHQDFCRVTGNAGVADIINHTGRMRGMEQVLCDIALEEEAYFTLVDRYLEVQLKIYDRFLSKYRSRVDLFWMGEDLGTQIAPILNPESYRRLIRPRHQRIVDLARSYDLPVMIHCCGSSSWAFGDFIEMGIQVIDTLQPEAVNMEPSYIKQTYGKQLAFHGCISTAGPVSFGTPDEVEADCRKKLEVLMPGGGYIFAPTHSLQDNSPVENVLRMYETAQRCGNYSKK